MWAGSAFILIALFIVNSLWIADSAIQVFFELFICTILALVVHLIWIKPKMVLRANMVEVVNPFRTETISYKNILALETKWILSIVHTEGVTRVWVAPATGKQRWIADKKFGWYASGFPLSESKTTNTEAMSASLESLSGQAAYLIRDRLNRLH